MIRKNENSITLFFLFSKTPEEEKIRKELLKKVAEQFKVLPLPLKLYKQSSTSISFASKNKLIALSFRKPIRFTYWIKGTNAEIEQFNDIINATSKFLNNIMAEFSETIELESEIELPLSDGTHLNTARFVNNQLLTNVHNKIGINLKVNALAFEFEYGEHKNSIVAVDEGRILVFKLSRKLSGRLPLDVLNSEKNHALKLADLLNQIEKIEAC